jgi:hypothetical protein
MVVKSVCFSVQATLSKWEWSPASAAFVLARHLRPLTSGHVFLSREVRVRRFVWAIMYEGVFGMYLSPSNSASSRLVTLFFETYVSVSRTLSTVARKITSVFRVYIALEYQLEPLLLCAKL